MVCWNVVRGGLGGVAEGADVCAGIVSESVVVGGIT